jgi:hypothetical protein
MTVDLSDDERTLLVNMITLEVEHDRSRCRRGLKGLVLGHSLLPIDSEIGRAEAAGRGGVLHILDDKAVRMTQPHLIARGHGRPFLQHLGAKRHQSPRRCRYR